jgi:uncharacterized repeat protein (TIGR01451 family)
MTSPDSQICGQEIATPSFPNNPHVGEYGCRFTSIAVGATVSMTLTVQVGPGATSVSNTATAYAGLNPIESADVDPNLTNNSATATVAIAQNADLSVTFAPPFNRSVHTNEQFSYSPVFTNFGPATARNIVITQDLPPNVMLISKPAFCTGGQQLTCAMGDLPGGLSAQPFIVIVQAPATATTLSSTVSVSSDTADPNAANNSETMVTSVTLPSADLSVTKSGGPTTVGTAAAYTITVHNSGPDIATNVTVTDPQVAGLTYGAPTWRIGGPSQPCATAAGAITCQAPSLAVGADMVVTIPVTASSAGTVTNNASVIATEADPNTADNVAQRTTTVRGQVDLALSKSDIGGIYRLVVTNNGPDPANAVTVTDTLPAGTSYGSGPAACSASGATVTCSLGTLAAGGSVAVTISAHVQTTGAITNSATVVTSDIDTNGTNDSASVTSTIITATDLAVAESAANGTGGTAVFTTTVTNTGPSTSHGATAFTSLPAGASAPAITSPDAVKCGLETVGPRAGQYGCLFGTIPAGASVTMTFSFQPPTGVGSTSATVTAYPGSGEFDVNPANDSATATLTLDNTPAGTNVAVAPRDTTTGTTPVTTTFSNVTAEGQTTLTTSPAGPPPPTGFTGFQLGTTYYDLHTTATFSGTVRVCITDASVTAATRLFHYEGGAWVDRTVLPVTPPTICADVTSFSLFAAFADTTPPVVAIVRPSGTYLVGQTVLAAYTCADAGTGVASCVGTTANGAAIDTASVGTNTFTVDAADDAGNTTHQTVTYLVTYRICAVPPVGQADGNGGQARVTARICDADGGNLSAAAIGLTALGVDASGLPTVGNAPTPTAFRFDARLRAYVYDVRLPGLTPGSHVLRFAVAGDPTIHEATFDVRRGQGGD